MNSALLEDQAKKPWFKQPWLWFVLSIPITSVILSSIMVTVAVVGKDSLVSDNYYKDGMAINQTIEQDLLADELKLMPKLSLDGRAVILELVADTSAPKYKKQAFITLKILHPTVSAQDIEIKLLPTQGDIFLGELPRELEGRRYLDLYAFDESWRIRDEVIFPLTEHTLNQGSANVEQNSSAAPQ